MSNNNQQPETYTTSFSMEAIYDGQIHEISVTVEGEFIPGEDAACDEYGRPTEMATGDTWDIHFEKSDVSFKGAAQMINYETAKFLEGTARYINREQDLGIPGLRQAKRSYVPHVLIEPYFLVPKLELRSH